MFSEIRGYNMDSHSRYHSLRLVHAYEVADVGELAVRGSLVLLPERLHVGLLRLAQGAEEPQQTGIWLISGLGQLHDLWRRHNMWSKAAQASDVRFFS